MNNSERMLLKTSKQSPLSHQSRMHLRQFWIKKRKKKWKTLNATLREFGTNREGNKKFWTQCTAFFRGKLISIYRCFFLHLFVIVPRRGYLQELVNRKKGFFLKDLLHTMHLKNDGTIRRTCQNSWHDMRVTVQGYPLA